jgi:L-amino acid N-acyltransferase YncA
MEIRASNQIDKIAFARLVEYTPAHDFRGITVFDDKGQVAVMIGYDHWSPNSVFIHILVLNKKFFTRRVLREAFKFPFDNGREVVLAFIHEGHKACRTLVEKAGFKLVHTIPDGWKKGEGLTVYEMREEFCRWYRRSVH